MSRCSNCGALMDQGMRVCPFCGQASRNIVEGEEAATELGPAQDHRVFLILRGRPGRNAEMMVAGVRPNAPVILHIPPEDKAGRPITMIGPEAFRRSRVSRVTLPSTVNTIGERAFQDVLTLYALEGGAGVALVEREAFQGCASLERCDFLAKMRGASPASMDLTAFAGCYQLSLYGENR